ncbi:MAG: restriction endonuclease [Cyanobacteria bacterium RI_101]|nr:restriction endonuclease [Cyanobacteria bacterium RI_101]
MTEKAGFALRGHNPDVLTCIANLSNDEVFTPPELANRMLDRVAAAWAANNGGANLWTNKTVRFLDPCAKSGVFLREIVRRLTEGLAEEIPDLPARVDHIVTRQVFGVGITHLTSLLARRSVYCSKLANGPHSIAKNFASEEGNIWFERLEHVWEGEKCKYCGASKKILDRGEALESHAYAFIHTDNIKTRIAEIFGENMQFDVIIGNPPYQLTDGGGMGTSATPIYHLFVQQGKKLSPRFLSMVIPSRWFSGGRGLDEFRKEMLNDSSLRTIVDFLDSAECFPGVDLSGGVCYFLWDRDNPGVCSVTTIVKGEASTMVRPLLEEGAETFIRYNKAIPILRKVREFKEMSFSEIVSANDPFGLDVRAENSYRRIKPKFSLEKFQDSLTFYYNGWRKEGIGYIEKSAISKNVDWTAQYKVFISKAYGERGSFPYLVLAKPFLGEPNSCCTETYLLIGSFASEQVAKNVISYIETRFFRFLVLLIKNTQNGMKKVYSFVPIQDFREKWTDEKLYKKYGITEEEIAFIESMIRPMGEAND